MTRPKVEDETPGFEATRGSFSDFGLNNEPIELMDLVNTVVVRSNEHHYAVVPGDLTSELREVATWFGMRTTQPVPVGDFLQIEGMNA